MNTSSISSGLSSDLISFGITFSTKSYIVVFGGRLSLSWSKENTAIPFDMIATIFSLSVNAIKCFENSGNLM